MSKRLEGGYLAARPTFSTAASPGVWTTDQHYARVYGGVWPLATPLFDPYFESVSLLLHMDGSNASTTFVDSSLGNLAVTANGNAQISTAQSKFGGSSGLFDGSGDGAIITTGLQNFSMTGNTYTLEAWIRPSVVSGSRPIITITAASVSFFGLIALSVAGGQLAWESRHDTGSSFANVNGTGGTVTADTWHHVALSVDNGTARAYLNGVQVGTNLTFTAPVFTIAGVGIGAFGNLYNISTDCFAGYIDEVRITRGVARYTANFVVPDVGSNEGPALYDPYFDYVSLLLRCNGDNNSTTFTDSSNNALTVTANGNAKISTTQARFGGASVYLDGAGDFLAIGTQSSFNFLHNGSNWTIELWIKPDNYLATRTILDTAIGASANVGIYIGLNSDRTISVGISRGVGGSFVLTGTFAGVVPNDNNWHHIAITYDHSKASANAMLYIDGSSQGSITKTANAPSSANATRQMYVGTFTGSTEFYLGYIDDLRITNGVVRYTTAFRPVGPYATSGKLVDPYLTSTSLLLPMTGDNGTTSFFDRSNNFLRATENGNAKVSTAISKFGAGAAYFDGTGDYLTFSANTALTFGTGDFTIELWLYPLAYGNTICGASLFGTVNGSTTGWSFNLGENRSRLRLISNLSGTWSDNLSVSTDGGPALNTWSHLALVRNGANITIYVNGASAATMSSAGSYNFGDGPFFVGRFNDGTNLRELNGYIDDLRITKGAARYTTAFTPPERAFNDEAFNDPHYNAVSLLLHMDGTNNSTTFTDSSVNGLTVTANGDAKISTAQSRFGGASAVFDGTGDTFTVSDSRARLSSGDHTVEFWFYVSALPTGGNQYYFWAQYYATGTPAGRCVTALITGGNVLVQLGSSSVTSTATVSAGTWNHFAYVRSGTTNYLFLNGVSQGSFSSSQTIVDTELSFGAQNMGTNTTPNYSQGFLAGYIDEFRLTKGIARYTSNFTPPTLPFYNTTIPTVDPSFSSVSLLLHMNGSNGSTTFTDSSSNALAVTANGNAQISTAQSKFGGASGAFDGAGDFLSIASTSFSSFSTGAFTVECWVYYTSISTYAGIVDTRSAVGFSNWCLGIYTVSATNRVDFITAGGRLTSNTAISAATWTHIAVVRDSGIIKIYINGVADSATFSYGSAIDATTNTRIGGTADLYYLNGYIDDLRITKGVARYTSNFYIPRAAFPDA